MKRILTFLFLAVFLVSLLLSAVPASAAAEAWRQVNYVTAGQTYLFACSGMNDTVVTHNLCVVKSVQSGDPHGLAYCEKPAAAPFANDLLWTVEAASGGYYLKSCSTGKYLNMKPAGSGDTAGKGYATMATTPQVLQLTFSGGKMKISASLNGTTYYIRFTNSYRSTTGYSCWEAATPDGSNQFTVFGRADREPEYANTGNPLFKVACFSDLHIDYGIHLWNPPIRQSTISSAQFVRDTLGAADVVLVGGDILSCNDASRIWSQNQAIRAVDTVYDTLSVATKDGKVMMITGNHDIEPGTYAGGTYDSADYDRYMLGHIGSFDASLRYNQMGIGNSKYNELLCYRYNVNGMEIISILTPYRSARSSGYIYGAQIDWVEQQLKAIGKNKTVIIQCHYPIENVYSPSGDPTGNSNTKIKALLAQYPNVIYTYGHIHGGDDKYAWYSTSELVVPQGTAVRQANNAFVTDSYITAHMGSMGYYQNQFNNNKALAATEPGINQLLMIEFYSDHITFRYYNTGTKTAVEGVREIASYTVMRDLSNQLKASAPSTNTNTNTSSSTSSKNTNTNTGSTSSNSGTPSDTGSVGSSDGAVTDLPDDGYTDDTPVFVPPVIDTEVNATKPESNAFSANLGGTADQLKNATLEDYELQWAANGDSVSVWLETKDVAETLADDVKDRVKGGDERTVGAWISLDLYTQMEGEESTAVETTKEKLTVTVTVPENLRNTDPTKIRIYTVLQQDGPVTAQYDPVSGMLTFDTTDFTYCALAYADADAPVVSDTGVLSTGITTDGTGTVTGAPIASTDPAGDASDGVPVGLIVAIAAGGVVLLAGGFALCYLLMRKKMAPPAEQ